MYYWEYFISPILQTKPMTPAAAAARCAPAWSLAAQQHRRWLPAPQQAPRPAPPRGAQGLRQLATSSEL